uniref:Uncharacterized protein n=1 Tax=Panagrolaimus sp. JU765 TaxID=591449 RepID=A0AC34R5I9_9BILA
MHLHVRSLKHIQSALCTINPDFAAELLAAKSETAVKALVAEYLKFNPAIKIPQKIREFNPLRAFHLNFTKQIPRFLLRLAETEFTLREGYIKENRIQLSQAETEFTLREGYIKENRIQLSQGRFKTTNDTDCVCMTTALQMTNLVQIRIDAKEIIFFCLDCQMSFSVFQNSAETIWTEHLLTEMHWKRMNTIQRSQLDLTKLMDEPSRYQPKIIEQSETDGKKKLVWTWNTDTQSYQFVVQNKLTFDDVAHREHFNGIA